MDALSCDYYEIDFCACMLLSRHCCYSQIDVPSSGTANEVLQYLCIRLVIATVKRWGISTYIACVYTVVCNVLTSCTFVIDCPGSLLHCCKIIIVMLICLPIGNIVLRRAENGQFVCPNRPVSLECTVQRARFLRWRINSTQLTCLGNANNGTLCLNSGNGAHAIITTVLPDSENLANITSVLIIDDIGDGVSVSCESQVSTVQEDLRSASMWTIQIHLSFEVLA